MKSRTPPTRDYSTKPDVYTRGFPARGKRKGMRQGPASSMAKRFAANLDNGLSPTRALPVRRTHR